MDNWNAGGYSFETDKSISNEDDEMAAFEAECARMLEQEHERRAKEERDAAAATEAEAAPAASIAEEEAESETTCEPLPEPEPQTAPEPEPTSEPEQMQERQPEPEQQPAAASDTEPEPEQKQEKQPEPTRLTHHDELVAIMRAESNESMRHSSAARSKEETNESTEEYSEIKDERLPNWLRLFFTVMLLGLGAAGLYVMVEMDYHSNIFDPLCFTEITICLLTAVGLNASFIPFRVGKEMIMRIAAYALFAFYVVYAADALFLERLLNNGIDKDHVMAYAKMNIHTDVVGGLTAMGNAGMLGCALFVVPFAFIMLVLFKPFRHIFLYLLTMAFLFFAVSAIRILTMSGSFDLSQGCMAMTGAVAAYVVFVFPPLRELLVNSGLILWEYDDDEDED